MRKTNLDHIWESLPKDVPMIFVMKDGEVIPAYRYDPVRTADGGYPVGQPKYDVSKYRQGWAPVSVRINKFDVSEIQRRERDYEYWLQRGNIKNKEEII